MADLQARDLARAELLALPQRADGAVASLDALELDNLSRRVTALEQQFQDADMKRLAARARKGIACRRRLLAVAARSVSAKTSTQQLTRSLHP